MAAKNKKPPRKTKSVAKKKAAVKEAQATRSVSPFNPNPLTTSQNLRRNLSTAEELQA